MDSWRINDYASDLLVLKLASPSSLERLCNLVDDGEDPVVISIICLSLYFMGLQLYAINYKKMDASHRISFV